MRLRIVEGVIVDQVLALGVGPGLIRNLFVRRVDENAGSADNIGNRGMFLDIPGGGEGLGEPDALEIGLALGGSRDFISGLPGGDGRRGDKTRADGQVRSDF